MTILKLRSRAGLVLVEQAANTGWNFIFGTLVARWGGVGHFGIFAVIMAVYFVLTAALSAMTVGIISNDVARLSRSRNAYLAHSCKAAERAALVVAGVGAIVICGVASTFASDDRWIIAGAGAAYLAINLSNDIRRRVLALGDHVKFLAMASSARVGALGLTATAASFFFSTGAHVPIVVAGAVTLSLAYFLVLGVHTKSRMIRGYGLPEITLARQIRLGGWGFASSFIMSGLDQGLMIYAGILGMPTVAAEIRAGSYLFGLMNPVMLAFNLIIPSVIHRILGRDMRFSHVAPFVLAGGMVSCLVAVTLSLLNAKVWLPFLGPDYIAFENISYWFGVSFACMTARSFIIPLLRTRVPRAIFHNSLLGTACGLIAVFLFPPFSAMAICKAMVCSAAIQLLSNTATLALVCTKTETVKSLIEKEVV